MNYWKFEALLLVAILALGSGRLWGDEAATSSNAPSAAANSAAGANQAAPNGQAAAVKGESPTLTAMKAANALLNDGKYAEAIAAYEKIGTLKSKKGEGWRLNNEGLACLLSNQNDKAQPLLEKAVAVDAANATAWNNLGSCYENLGQMEKAKDAYQKSIDAAKDADASSTKAEANLAALQARMDVASAKDESPSSNVDNESSDPPANKTASSNAGAKAQNGSKQADAKSGDN